MFVNYVFILCLFAPPYEKGGREIVREKYIDTTLLEDVILALQCADEDENIGWSSTFSLTDFCLVNSNNYTIKAELKKGETIRFIQCQNPYRTDTWYCNEVYDECIKQH